jgi:hypothetical protein
VEIRRLYNVNGVITDGPGQSLLVGPGEQWVEELTGLVVEAVWTPSSSSPEVPSTVSCPSSPK